MLDGPDKFPGTPGVFSEVKLAADAGDAAKQWEYALLLEMGNPVIPPDDAKSFRQYLKAAEQDHAAAACTVGWRYAAGVGVEQNNDKVFPPRSI